MHRSRRLGLHLEARRHGEVAFDAANVAAPLGRDERRPMPVEPGNPLDALDPLVEPRAGNGPPEERVNILLVDDRPDKLLSLEVALSELKQNLVLAKSGKEALRCLLKQEFAVIL